MYGKSRVRVLEYRDNSFRVLMSNDATEWIDRKYLRFIKGRTKK
jgi:hypothetical protein